MCKNYNLVSICIIVVYSNINVINGFQKNGDTIVMDPCIPKKWTEYSINYLYLDTPYEIVVQNPEGVNKGVKKLVIDKKESKGNVINLVNDGKTHKVEVILGK